MEKLKKWVKMFKKDERGLTLVELLATIVILGIVGVIAFVAVGNVIENSKKDAHIANAQQIISAAELHVATGGDLEELGGDPSKLETLGDLGDPWGEYPEKDSEGTTTYLGTFTLGTATTEGATDNTEVTIQSTHSNCSFGDGESYTRVQLSNLDRDEVCPDPN